MVKFKKWRDLPDIPGKRLEGRVAVGIDPRYIYTFGGRPFDSTNSIMGLDLELENKGWFAYND